METARASAYLGRLNIKILAARAGHRQAQGRGEGARAPASIAAAPVDLVELVEAVPGVGGAVAKITPLGYRTARRRPVPLIDALPERDPRRQAAELLQSSLERLGSLKGADLAGGDTKGGISDGGATTKIKHAERLILMRALVNGWPVYRGRPVAPGMPPRVALKVGRNGGARQRILAFDALVLVLSDGVGLYEILRRHGWSAQAKNARPLSIALLAALDDLADGLGYGRACANSTLDS